MSRIYYLNESGVLTSLAVGDCSLRRTNISSVDFFYVENDQYLMTCLMTSFSWLVVSSLLISCGFITQVFFDLISGIWLLAKLIKSLLVLVSVLDWFAMLLIWIPPVLWIPPCVLIWFLLSWTQFNWRYDKKMDVLCSNEFLCRCNFNQFEVRIKSSSR